MVDGDFKILESRSDSGMGGTLGFVFLGVLFIILILWIGNGSAENRHNGMLGLGAFGQNNNNINATNFWQSQNMQNQFTQHAIQNSTDTVRDALQAQNLMNLQFQNSQKDATIAQLQTESLVKSEISGLAMMFQTKFCELESRIQQNNCSTQAEIASIYNNLNGKLNCIECNMVTVAKVVPTAGNVNQSPNC